MREEFLHKLCCPQDKSDLELEVFVRDTESSIIEGMLTCPECERFYPIVQGVPIMTPDEYRQRKLEEPILKKWGLRLNDSSKKFELLEEG
ncbi:Trm112 family protein [Membranihabitans maritimus]|uniref:Trm112 family protein n=1 Tax=Membranihabitans maritimus TaxID=2904244 RepID=UPI001F1D28E2|nr:Trm112 family protein [Membranihabitans maritimus]